MESAYPPLLELASLPQRALVFAPHPDDEVLGCGGLLAMLADRGDALRIVIATDGELGASPGVTGLAEVRQAESRAAAAELGVRDLRFLGLPDGRLGGTFDLTERLRAAIEEFDPDLVLGPSPFEQHADHRALSSALVAALAAGRERRVMLYGVNAPVPAGSLVDVTAQWHRKRAAISCFASQLASCDLIGKAESIDRGRTANVDDPEVRYVEGFADMTSSRVATFEERAEALLECLFRVNGAAPPRVVGDSRVGGRSARTRGLPPTTAVISTWNKASDLRDNLLAVRAQTLPFEDVIVVDNHSEDSTADLVRTEFPEVRLIVMPNSDYGACETFNVGFASSRTELTAILDDDIVMPPEWLEKTTLRLLEEPDTTAVLSTKIVEPDMPEGFRSSPALNRERYMSTFRGCASLARTRALREAGFYDERLFIYGNERDLTCRLLNLGYRVLQYPCVETFHKTPFGIKMGKRSLYYHSRNVWLTMLKYAPLRDLARLPWLVAWRVVLRRRASEEGGAVTDATGTIGIARSISETPMGWWVVFRAALSVLWNVPYCLKRRRPVVSEDFELPLR